MLTLSGPDGLGTLHVTVRHRRFALAPCGAGTGHWIATLDDKEIGRFAGPDQALDAIARQIHELAL